MATVTLEGVCKVYPNGVQAVQSVDLEIADKQMLVLLGPSGCGKSTLLRMIAGLEELTSGSIHIGGRDVTTVAPRDRDVAMVFQNYALYPHMSVLDNLAFGLRIRNGAGWLARIWNRLFRPKLAKELAAKRQEIPGRVHEVAKTLGIDDLLGRMPRQLSGGQRQRVALGRAIVREPAAFLFDEPLSNLDAKLRIETRRELKQIHRRLEATMIYVTHDQVEAMTLGDKVAIMDAGQLQQIGTPDEVYHRPANVFVASFIGTPPMNLVQGKIVWNEFELLIQIAGRPFLTLSLEGQDGMPVADVVRELWVLRPEAGEMLVTIGFRPEDVSCRAATDSDVVKESESGPLEVVEIEDMGDASLLHLRLPRLDSSTRDSAGDVDPVGESSVIADLPQQIVCKIAKSNGGDLPSKIGEKLVWSVAPDSLHFFDADSGLRLLGDG